VSAQTAVALVLALMSTTLTNVAYLREHDAAAALPALSLRRPLHSVQALLRDRSWLAGFALESGGFALYVAARALAPLTLVQSISAGGIGILAFVSARMSGRRLGRHELAGVLLSTLGLLALAVSLAGGSGEGTGGSTFAILLWLAATAAAASGVFGGVRVAAFAAVTLGAILLARPDRAAGTSEPTTATVSEQR
jgi:hypothetical protein